MSITQTRRMFMQLIGLTSFNAPRVMAELPVLLSAPSTMAVLAANRSNAGLVGECVALPQTSPRDRLGKVLAQQIEHMKHEVEDELYLRRSVRELRFLDGDLQSMRSVSVVNRQRMQRERDKQYHSLLRRAEQALWG